jgi:hypothetical protein
MSPRDLIQQLVSSGVTLAVVGNRLRFRPVDRVKPAMVELLRQHKQAIISLLIRPKRTSDGLNLSGLNDDEIEHFHERAAIREIDGGQSRRDAELGAMSDVMASRPAPLRRNGSVEFSSRQAVRLGE